MIINIICNIVTKGKKTIKLYHYARKENTIMKDGLLSFSKSKVVNVKDYRTRAEGLDKQEDVIRWMESCFEGRSRGIRFFLSRLNGMIKLYTC